ncbi:MAG: hypothetical protein RLY14_2859, partial [Planctomycetota bacterium]
RLVNGLAKFKNCSSKQRDSNPRDHGLRKYSLSSPRHRFLEENAKREFAGMVVVIDAIWSQARSGRDIEGELCYYVNSNSLVLGGGLRDGDSSQWFFKLPAV